MTKSKLLLWNSAVAFTLAGLLAITAHEAAHLISGALAGRLPATLYPNAVDFAGASGTAVRVFTALAGPVFSLLSGLALIWCARHWGRGFGRLFWLWFAFLSAQIGFGYMIVAPFMQAGDTGQALMLLNAPTPSYIVTCLAGVSGMFWLARLFAVRAVGYVSASDVQSLRNIGLLAWLAGTGALMAIYTVASGQLSSDVVPGVLAGVVTIGIFTPLLTFLYRKAKADPEELVLARPIAGMIMVVVVATLLLLNAGGLKIG